MSAQIEEEERTIMMKKIEVHEESGGEEATTGRI